MTPQSTDRTLRATHRQTGLPAMLALIAVIGAWTALAGVASGFHERGVANCGGCHTVHNSQDGAPMGPEMVDAMLLYDTPSDLCLSCHAGALGEVLGGDPLSPPPEHGGGNFTFLYEDNLNDGPDGLANPIGGNHAGHNLVAPGWGLFADPDHAAAPGGGFPSSELGCTSCHDPHGNENFRMLWGLGATLANGWVFDYPAPEGQALPLSVVETPSSHTAYNEGWSQWCANCHGDFNRHSDFGWDHPTYRAIGVNRRSYNHYDGPQAPYGGEYATAYLPAVPIEGQSITTESTTGADPGTRLSCLSCHRAHATSAPAALRWDPNITRLAEDGVVSGSYPIPDPYDDPEQRALCVKCHWPEAQGHGLDAPCMSCHRNLEGSQGREVVDPATLIRPR